MPVKYLLCHHCGQCSPLRSEFLTFCEHCGKKLLHNYADWQRKHPEGSFEQFCRQVSVTGEAVTGDAAALSPGCSKMLPAWVRYSRSAGRKGLMVACLLVLALAAAGAYFGKQTVITLLYPKVAETWLYASWQHLTIGRQAMEISTPVPLHINDKPLSPELAPLVSYTKSYSNQPGAGMQICVNMRSYWQSAPNTLEGATAETIRAMQEEPDITVLQYTSHPAARAGANGVVLEGTYLYREAVQLAFYNLVMVRGEHRWQLSIHYRADDNAGRQVAARMLRSVKVINNEKGVISTEGETGG